MHDALACVKSRATLGHRFDPVSGWCEFPCGVRDDGRVVSRHGDRIRLSNTEWASIAHPERTTQ